MSDTNLLPSETATELREIIERAERHFEEREQIAGLISDLYKEARGRGFNVKAIKQILAMRKKDPAKLREEQAMVELYILSLGYPMEVARVAARNPDAALRGSDGYPSDMTEDQFVAAA